MEADNAPDIHGPADGHRTATGPYPGGDIAKRGNGTQVAGVK